MTAPGWLLEAHGTVEEALVAAEARLVEYEKDMAATHRVLDAAMKAKHLADEEFAQAGREWRAAYDRYHNVRRHRDWVRTLQEAP